MISRITPLAAAFSLLLPSIVRLNAQITIVTNSPGANEVALCQTYVQTFDSLPASGSAAWANNSTLRGWYANLTAGQVSTGNLTTTTPGIVSAVNSGSVGGSATLNSLGASGSTNRALGGTPSAYGTPSADIFSSQSVNAVLRLKNNTGGVLTGLKVAYDTIATSTNRDAVALAYRVFNAGAGTISSGFIETHRYLNTFSGNFNESMRTEYGRVVTSTDGWTCVVKDIAPQATVLTNHLEFALRDLAANPGDEVWLAWHIAKEDEQGPSDPITTTAIDNVSVGEFTVGRPGMPFITSHPRQLAVASTGTRDFKLSVEARGSGLSYQWRLNGTNLPGFTSATYAATNVNSAYEGFYDVIVSNSVGSVTSLPAWVNIYGKKVITTNLDVSFASYSSGISQLEAAAGGTLCDLYYPTNLASGAPAPAVIVIHGGGGNNGDKSDTREVEAAVELAGRGWFVMVINYAMSSSSVQCWPYNLWDAKQAVRWLKQKADAGTYNIDKTRIGALGFSWGCNMASMLAMTGTNDDVGVVSSTLKVEPPVRGNSYDNYSTEVQCSAVFYGACDLPNYHQMNQFLNYTAWDNRTLYRRASPVNYPNATAAPMLVSHGSSDDDVWASQTETMYQFQRSAGARLEPYMMVPGGQHSFYLYGTANVQSGFPSPIEVRPETFGFFEKFLVETNHRPAITVEPVSRIATAGTNVTFSVGAWGTPAPSFQWRKDGAAIAGATSSNYTFAVNAGTAGFYDCVVSNTLGSIASAAALLTVEGPIPPTAPVANADSANTLSNTPVTITVLANDSDANGDLLTIVDVSQGTNGSVVINGGTNVTYTPNAGFTGLDAFTYTITDGNAGTNSALVTVVVSAPAAPSFTSQPTNLTVVVGANVTFSCSATGTAPLSFQWSKGGNPINGATNASYSLSNVSTNDAGVFAVTATNLYGSVTSSNATLTVTVPVISVVTNFTTSGTWICPPGITTVQVECWGGGGGGAGTAAASNKAGGGGAGGAYVKNISVPVTPGTVYTVIVGAGGFGGGAGSSNANTNTAGAASVFTNANIVGGVSVVAGGGAKGTYDNPGGTGGTGSVAGNSGFSGSFSYAGGNGANGVGGTYGGGGGSGAGTNSAGGNASTSNGGTSNAGGGSGANGPTTSANGQAGSAPGGGGSGGVSVGTTGRSGGAGARGQITLAYSSITGTAPLITQQPAGQTNAEGSSVTLSVIASGSAPLAYQWRKNATVFGGATNGSLIINPASTNDNGGYDVIITNNYGAVTSLLATLVITNIPPTPPTITTPPQSQTNTLGASATFSVIAAGTAPLSYQWRKAGVDIIGATSNFFSISPLAFTNAGSFTVVVTNLYGSVTSSAASLTVLPLPPTNAVFASSWATVRDGANFTVDIDEAAAGYVMVKYSLTGAAAKGYLEFDLTNQHADGSQPATLSVTRASSGGTQRLRLWALNQSYQAMSNNLVWASAQANETNSNAMLTNGAFTATQLLEVHSAGGTGSNTFTIPAPWGQFISSNKLVLAFTAGEPVAPDTNSAAGYRISIATNLPLPLLHFYPLTGAPSTEFQLAYDAGLGLFGGQNVIFTNAGAQSFKAWSSSDPTLPVTSWTLEGVMNELPLGTSGNSRYGINLNPGTSPVYYIFATTNGGPYLPTENLLWLTTDDYVTYNVFTTNMPISTNGVFAFAVPPMITQQPAGLAVIVGQRANFAVSATGTGLNYQWRFNNADLPGATLATFSLTNVTVTQAGNYSVFVTNGVGAVTSSNVLLQVFLPPQVTASGASPGNIQLTGNSVTGLTFVVQESTNLSGSWKSILTNNTGLSGIINFNTNTTIVPSVFYRLMFP